jgi:small-conductance mechanosensitive channel
MPVDLQALWDHPWMRAGLLVAASLALATIAEMVLRRAVLALTRKTKTDLDDVIVEALRRPVFVSIAFAGTAFALRPVLGDTLAMSIVDGVLQTVAILVWASTGIRLTSAVLDHFARRAGEGAVLQPQTLPVFEIGVKTTIVAGGLYLTLLAWKIDVTAWLASAGIVGVAVGFAAKDSLANLFAGVFILADAPYKLGDMIVLDQGLRGRVSRIGLRSTRILTLDGVEVTVPNTVISAARIVNESGGPAVHQRIRTRVQVAYGCDVDRVREILLAVARETPDARPEPPPGARFVQFADSGLAFEVLVWIDDAAARDDVLDVLNTRIYAALGAAGIEIPYAKQDVYIKEMPASGTRPPR